MKSVVMKLWYIEQITVIPLYKGSSRQCGLYEQLSFIYRLKLHVYALFINEKNETVLYRQ